MPVLHAIAVDLGGTRTRVAVVREDGSIEAAARFPTPVEAGPDAVVAAIEAGVVGARMQVRSTDPVVGVGVAAPGPIDPASGIVIDAPNMPGWRDFPLVERLSRSLDLPVWAHNDANLAGLAEARVGAGRGHDPIVYLTVSTGVGGGVIINGEMLVGARGLAGELGHVIVQGGGPSCNLGHPGCLEGLASGTAIARRAAEALAAGEASRIPEHCDPAAVPGDASTAEGASAADGTRRVTAEAVARAAEAGDALAVRLYAEAGTALGWAIGGFINVFDPERVVIGGGVTRAWPLFAPTMGEAVRSVAMAMDHRTVDIVPALHGDDAGLVGAALHAFARAQAAP